MTGWLHDNWQVLRLRFHQACDQNDEIIAECCIAIACNSRCLIIFHWLCVFSVFSSIPLFWTWIFFWVLFGALSEANLMRLDKVYLPHEQPVVSMVPRYSLRQLWRYDPTAVSRIQCPLPEARWSGAFVSWWDWLKNHHVFHGAFPAGSGASSCGLAKGGIQSSRWGEVADLGWKRCNLLMI